MGAEQTTGLLQVGACEGRRVVGRREWGGGARGEVGRA